MAVKGSKGTLSTIMSLAVSAIANFERFGSDVLIVFLAIVCQVCFSSIRGVCVFF